ncbi:MAG: Hac prophage orf3 [Thermoleophilia bacterium]|nr:Hac prophage orf3 [Thermoleophilia bacterium]
MAPRKAKLPRGINVRTNPSGDLVYEWQVVRDGKRKREGGFRTISAAEKGRDEFLRLLDGGASVEAIDMTVRDLYSAWLDTYVKVALQESSRADYENHWRNRIEPLMAHLPVGTVNKRVARDVVAQLKRAGTGNRTINKTITALSSMWTFSMETYNWPETNPWHADRARNRKSTKKLRVAEVSRRPVRPQSAETIHAVAAELPHLRDRTMLLLDHLTGLRIGELIGILWDDVLDDHLIVSGNVSSILRERKDMTKTISKPCREVELMPMARALLAEWRRAAPDSSLVFPNVIDAAAPRYGGRASTKEVISATSWSERVLKPAIVRAGAPRFTMQNVRQTYISNMLMAGKAPLWVAGQSGNSPQVIYDHYARYIKALQSDTDLTAYFAPAPSAAVISILA